MKPITFFVALLCPLVFLSCSKKSMPDPAPVLNVSSVINIGIDSAVSGGTVPSTQNVASRGVCWGTNANPTIELNSHTTDGSSTGDFKSQLNQLSPATTYYVRAYVIQPDNTVVYSSQTKFTTLPLTLAVKAFGGYIVYIDATNQHGLVVSTSDLSSSVVYFDPTFPTLRHERAVGTTSQAIGAGLANTNTIIATYGNAGNYAALLCRNYKGGGYSDWFLPSLYELAAVFSNKTHLPYFSGASDGTTSYWTSSESGGGATINNVSYPDPWQINMATGIQSSYSILSSGNATYACFVRAVRAF